jgi:hypothetical protein
VGLIVSAAQFIVNQNPKAKDFFPAKSIVQGTEESIERPT